MNYPINVRVAVCKTSKIAKDPITHYTTMPAVVKTRTTGEVDLVLYGPNGPFFPGAFTGDMVPVVKPGDVK